MMVHVTARIHIRESTLKERRGETRMDIKVGFVSSPRDLVINSKDEDRDALLGRVEEFLGKDSGVLKLEDSKGAVVVVVREQVAYIEVGAAVARAVGFI